MFIKKEEVDEAVIEFCVDVVKNPLLYFSECDLQFLLSEKLKKNISQLQNKYPTNYPISKGGTTCFKTSLLHREYGVENGREMDICIFSEEQINEINHWNLTKNEESGYIKPHFGFELGCEKTREENHMVKDLEELKENCNDGYIIHFFKDNTIAQDGTLTRMKKDDVIKIKFKDMVVKSNDIIKSDKIKNVKIVAILINLFRKQDEEWPQCEIFNKSNDSNWIPYKALNSENIKEIKKLLNAQLN